MTFACYSSFLYSFLALAAAVTTTNFTLRASSVYTVGSGAFEAEIIIHVTSNLVRINITSDMDHYFGIGFGGSVMQNTYAIIVGDPGTVQERILGNHAQGTELTQPSMVAIESLIYVRSGFSDDKQYIILTRERIGVNDTFYTFPDPAVYYLTNVSIPVIYAYGSSNNFTQHAGRTSTDLLFFSLATTTEPPTAEPSTVGISSTANTSLLYVACTVADDDELFEYETLSADSFFNLTMDLEIPSSADLCYIHAIDDILSVLLENNTCSINFSFISQPAIALPDFNVWYLFSQQQLTSNISDGYLMVSLNEYQSQAFWITGDVEADISEFLINPYQHSSVFMTSTTTRNITLLSTVNVSSLATTTFLLTNTYTLPETVTIKYDDESKTESISFHSLLDNDYYLMAEHDLDVASNGFFLLDFGITVEFYLVLQLANESSEFLFGTDLNLTINSVDIDRECAGIITTSISTTAGIDISSSATSAENKEHGNGNSNESVDAASILGICVAVVFLFCCIPFAVVGAKKRKEKEGEMIESEIAAEKNCSGGNGGGNELAMVGKSKMDDDRMPSGELPQGATVEEEEAVDLLANVGSDGVTKDTENSSSDSD